MWLPPMRPTGRRPSSAVISGRKWRSSGAGDPQRKVAIVLGKSNPDAPRNERHSMIIVLLDAGVHFKRMLPVFGYDDAPQGHAENLFDNVRVPASNIIWGEGKGFAIAQDRPGPGRIHSECARSEWRSGRWNGWLTASGNRVAFGSLSERGVIREWIADSRIEIEQARLLTLKAAYMMDTMATRGPGRRWP